MLPVPGEIKHFYLFFRGINVSVRSITVRRYHIGCSGRLRAYLLAQKSYTCSRNSGPDLLTSLAVTVRVTDGHGVEGNGKHPFECSEPGICLEEIFDYVGSRSHPL